MYYKLVVFKSVFVGDDDLLMVNDKVNFLIIIFSFVFFENRN